MIFRFGDYELREQIFELHHRGVKVAVQPKVLHLLIHLVRNRTRAVTREELFRTIWSEVTVAEASLSRAVVEARKAIGDDAQEKIVTVRGVGFRFAIPVAEAATGTPPPAPAPTFVGREACVAALGARMEGILGGRAAMAWVSGVAGIGKTRLVEEIAALARGRGIEAHVARCHESPSPPPFWAWASLGKALATPAAREDPFATLELDADLAAFDAVTRAVVAMADARPLVLAIDDLHWADEGTLSLLRYFAREVRDARILVLCAYRDGPVADDARGRALGALLREYGSLTIPLRGLSRDETARLVEALEGTRPSARLASAIHEKTGGCPLFVHQILETEWAAGALRGEARAVATSVDLQQGLLESIGRHLDGVSTACREVLGWAAVLGKEFDFAALAKLTRLDAGPLLDRLDEATKGNVVEEAGEGHYAFVHPLVADVLYKKLPASERASRHRAAGAVLEAHYAQALDVHAHRIARHYLRAAPAGTAREAFAFASRAARHAAARGDLPGAIKHWERAVKVLDLLAGSETARLGAVLDLARARASAGDAEGARDAFLDAAVLARVLAEPEALADAALAFAKLAPPGDPRAASLLRDAHAEARPSVAARASEADRVPKH